MLLMLMALVTSATPDVRPSTEEADAVVARAFAHEPSPAAAAPSSGAGPRTFGWVLALGAAAALAALALKRRSQKVEEGYAQVAQNLAVGPKRSLLVVSFGGKQLLLGASEAGFTVLASEPLPPGAPGTPFDRALEQQLEAMLAGAQKAPGGAA